MNDIFEIIKKLNNDEIKLYLVLLKLSEKYGYTYITITNLATKMEIEKKIIISNLYSLVKKKILYFIDIKDQNNNLVEKRFYTDKFKYFKDNNKNLKPTISKKEKNQKVKEIEKQNEEKNKKELKILVDEYYSNMSSIEYVEKLNLAEERYKKLMGGIGELNDFQSKIFESSIEIYIKEIIKEELAKKLNFNVELYFN